jgi:hypothetical protein
MQVDGQLPAARLYDPEEGNYLSGRTINCHGGSSYTQH